MFQIIGAAEMVDGKLREVFALELPDGIPIPEPGDVITCGANTFRVTGRKYNVLNQPTKRLSACFMPELLVERAQ